MTYCHYHKISINIARTSRAVASDACEEKTPWRAAKAKETEVLNSGMPTHMQTKTYLVGGFNPSEKILANGKDYPIYYGK